MTIPYTKTTWVDGVTPVSAANLNKLEQGIYDNSNAPAAHGLRNLLDPATQVYTGTSARYKKNGVQVPVNTLRLEQGKFGQMPFIEEAATNLIPLDKQKFVGWTASGGATITLTQDITVSEWGATDATRIQTSGGTGVAKYYTSIESPSVNGQAYRHSIKIKNIGTTTVRVNTNLSGGYQDVTSGQTVTVDVGATGNGSTALQFRFDAINIGDSLDFYAWRPMAVAKAYSVSWTDSTRSADQLYYTLAQPLPVQNFGALVWTPEQGSTPTRRRDLLYITDSNNSVRYTLRYDYPSAVGKFRLVKSPDGATAYELLSSATTFSAGDRVFLAWLVDPAGSNMNLWAGVNSGSLAEYSLADSVEIPGAQKVYAGCYDGLGNECNGTIDFPILSDILPTSAQVEALYRAQDWGGMRNYPGIISAETKTPAGDTIFTDAGGTVKGPINFVNANVTVKHLNNDLMAESLIGYQMLSSKLGTYIMSNCYHNGSNWMRRDIAQPACMILPSISGLVPKFYSAAAGANPITAWNTYTLWHSGNDGAGSGLDADTLDTYQPNTGTTAGTIPVRDGTGKVPGSITGDSATVANKTPTDIISSGTYVDTTTSIAAGATTNFNIPIGNGKSKVRFHAAASAGIIVDCSATSGDTIGSAIVGTSSAVWLRSAAGFVIDLNFLGTGLKLMEAYISGTNLVLSINNPDTSAHTVNIRKLHWVAY